MTTNRPAKRTAPSRRVAPAQTQPETKPAEVEPEAVEVQEESVETSEELTPEQIQIRDLQDQLAKALGSKDPELENDVVANPGDEKNILIHFVRDGFCELGTVWYRGQELELEPNTPQYTAAKKWALLDSAEQETIYGAQYYRQGSWRGKEWEDEEAAKAEKSRGRAAPRISK